MGPQQKPGLLWGEEKEWNGRNPRRKAVTRQSGISYDEKQSRA